MSQQQRQQPQPEPILNEMSLLCSEAEAQMQRALNDLHEALVNRRAELRRRSERASGGAKGSLELRRRRLRDELRHSERMAHKANQRGDAEEAVYRAAQAEKLSLELAAAEAEYQAGVAVGWCDDVSKDKLTAMFAEAADELATRLLDEMRVTAKQVAEREISELTSEEGALKPE